MKATEKEEMNKSKIATLAELRNAFCKRWAPGRDNIYNRDFEIALDSLIYAVFSVAQAPFIHELQMTRDDALDAAALSLKPSKIGPIR